MFCPSCKAELADGMKFCTQCGAKLEAEKTPAAQASADSRQVSQMQKPASPVQQQPSQRPQQPIASSQPVMQPQIQQQRPQQQKKQKPPKNAGAPKKIGPVPFIALGISVVALVLAIVGFILPSPGNQSSPKIINAGTAEVTIKAGDSAGGVKILDENTPCIVVATSLGGDATYSDVMFDPPSGELRLTAKSTVSKDTSRSISWVAYEK